MGDLLRSRHPDAVLVVEPFRSRLVGDGTDVLVANFLDDVLRNQIVAFWITGRKWAAQNGPAIGKFREAVEESLAFVKNNEAEAREIQKKYLGANAKDLPSYEMRVPVQDLKFFQDLGKELGLLKGTGDPANLILR
jgi:NitT/TauT family transport system substrate-binding protein